MKRLLIIGLLAILTTTLSMAQTNKNEILSDELCDKLCEAAHEKSKELGVDISFAIADKNGLPRVYRRYGDALVLSITLVPDKESVSVNSELSLHENNTYRIESQNSNFHRTKQQLSSNETATFATQFGRFYEAIDSQ